MAVTVTNSTQMDKIDGTVAGNLPTHELHGRVRMAFFKAVQAGGAGDAGSSFLAAQLPGGSVRVLGAMSNIHMNWTTAAATVDVGWDAYQGITGGVVAADPDGMDDGVSVETAGAIPLCSANAAEGNTKLFESQAGVSIRLTSPGVLANGSTSAGYIAYVVD